MNSAQESHKNIIYYPLKTEIKVSHGLGPTFYEKMLEHKDKVAHTDGITGKQDTFGDVLQKTIRVALKMRAVGIKPKDVVTICSYNTLDSFIPYYATFFMGAVSANLDPKLPQSELTFLMRQVGPKIIFVAPEALQVVENAVHEIGIDVTIVEFGGSSKYLRFSEFLLPSPEEDTFTPYDVENLKDTAVIVFSSGSTGFPKGICLTHYGLLSYAFSKNYTMFRSPIVLNFANLYWIAATSLTPSFIIFGANRIIYPMFDPVKAWDLIKTYKTIGMFLNTFHALEFFKSGRPNDADTSTLKSVIITGSPISADQLRHMRSCIPGTILLNGYGQTELSGGTMEFDEENPNLSQILEEKPTTIGNPRPGYIYKVVDPETQEILGPNQEGELLIKTDRVMNGYYKKDSSDVFDSEGFFRTGDIVYYDNEQYFFIVDRVKDLLKFQMWQISPATLEARFCRHPAVHDCIVIGIPHPVDGDHPMGVVVLNESYVGKITEKELQKYVDDQVEYIHKIRGGVKFVKSYPLTQTQKYDRRKLRQLILEEKI